MVQAKLLEHNVRFGDPECQCLMLRLESDLLQALLCAASGQLQGLQLSWTPESALCVIMAAKGYPGAYAKNTLIKGLGSVSGAKVKAFTGIYKRQMEGSSGACFASDSQDFALNSVHEARPHDCCNDETREAG